MSEEMGPDESQHQTLEEAKAEITRLKEELVAREGEGSSREPIAIIGMGCRYPGGVRTPDEFWHLLSSGKDILRDIPDDRWDIDSHFDPEITVPGKMYVRQGYYLDDIDQFVDEPIADSSIIPTYLISKIAGTHVKVALGGDGGDEIERLSGEGQSDTGWKTFKTQVSLDAGTHTIDLGVYNNLANSGNELTDVWFDDIVINYSGGGSRSGVLENDFIDEPTSVTEIESNPSHGTLSMNDDGTFTYLPEIDFFGVDQFSYRIVDSEGRSDPALVTINV